MYLIDIRNSILFFFVRFKLKSLSVIKKYFFREKFARNFFQKYRKSFVSKRFDN